MNFIVAVDDNFAIGYQNNLLYSIKQDMQFFKQTTLNKIVVMGENTFLSLPNQKALKNRTNIVVTLDKNFNKPDVIVANDFKQLSKILEQYEPDDVFVMGGASIYTQLIPYCKYGYITKIKASKTADRFLPNLDNDPNWKVIYKSEDHEENGLVFNFCTYENSNPLPFKFD